MTTVVKRLPAPLLFRPQPASRLLSTPIRGVVWAIAYFAGFVLWPFATVALQQSTGSFKPAFLCIPVFMLAMALGVWLWVPEHAGKELNKISV
jgi:hypothetical protein